MNLNSYSYLTLAAMSSLAGVPDGVVERRRHVRGRRVEERHPLGLELRAGPAVRKREWQLRARETDKPRPRAAKARGTGDLADPGRGSVFSAFLQVADHPDDRFSSRSVFGS